MPLTPFTDLSSKGARKRGVAPWAIGAIAIVVIVVGAFFAYTKANPFASPYQLTAIFESANEMKQNSPVRIAGVDVGKVKSVESMKDGSGLAEVKMEITDEGLPIKEDAELTIRSRLFLEGNYFVDLHPGSPSADELGDGSTIGPDQTANPVQFGQVITALQSDTREDLRTFLDEYSRALTSKGYRGADGFNQAIEHWEDAWKNTSAVNEATLGLENHDLSQALRGQGKVYGALSRDEDALKNFVTHLNTTAAAFAREEDALSATIPQLRDVLKVGRPALQSLNSGLPSLRRFAQDALPGARSTPETLDAQLPFVQQARRLVSEDELGGLTRELKPTIPALARLNESTALQLAQNRSLSACQNNVLLPFSKEPIPDPDFPEASGEPWYEVSQRAWPGLAGESRHTDANSPFFRIQGGGGPTTLTYTGETGERYFAQALFPVEGVRPAAPSQRPKFRPDLPCEQQETPDLNAPAAAGDQQVDTSGGPAPKFRDLHERALSDFEDVREHLGRVMRGERSVDPLIYDDKTLRRKERQLGIEDKGDKR
jgi:phospholipid/cholesterol/gamma-HCH transport system substrate-binding protein